MSMTLCDLSVNSQISPTVAKIFVSNFRQGFETENANEEFAATNSQALKDGFNTGVKKSKAVILAIELLSRKLQFLEFESASAALGEIPEGCC